MFLLNEIEKVEIAIRRAIMNIPVQITGDIYWLTNSVHFANQRTFQDTKNTIDKEYAKSTEEFIKHFKNCYCDPYPPSWILGELLTMGNVNMVFRNLKADKIRKRISHYFGLQPIVLERLQQKWGYVLNRSYTGQGNPILPGFHADPEILYSNKTGKYYIYSTTDGKPGWGGYK
jgi:abortive infection bacteriophage resistance protein